VCLDDVPRDSGIKQRADINCSPVSSIEAALYFLGIFSVMFARPVNAAWFP
jgi:hypothetical protein